MSCVYHSEYSNKKGCPLSFIAISQGAVRGAQFQQQLDLQRQQRQHEQQQQEQFERGSCRLRILYEYV
jgi:membrane protease subunit (stomatin/prohibitin family)